MKPFLIASDPRGWNEEMLISSVHFHASKLTSKIHSKKKIDQIKTSLRMGNGVNKSSNLEVSKKVSAAGINADIKIISLLLIVKALK